MKHIVFAIILSLFMSCSSDKEKDYVALNEQEIQDYLAANNLEAQRSSSGLYYIIDALGIGEQPTSASNVTVAYKGYLTNETVFDESDAEGISFNLNQVIAGWTEGITYFKEGGSGMLLIPSHLAYGNRSVSIIPANAVLVFEIDLISVN